MYGLPCGQRPFRGLLLQLLVHKVCTLAIPSVEVASQENVPQHLRISNITQ